jgi:hypothetical protein
VDGHLDLAANVIVEGRYYTLSAAEIRAIQRRTDQQATVSLPDLVRGGVGVVFATLFAEPDGAGYSDDGYTTPQGPARQALDQLAVYERWEDEGRIRIIRSRGDLERHLAAWESDRVRRPGVGKDALLGRFRRSGRPHAAGPGAGGRDARARCGARCVPSCREGLLGRARDRRMRSSPRTRTPGRTYRATSPWRAYERLAAQLLIGSIQPHELVCVLADEHSTPDAVRFEAEVRDIVNQRLERLAVTSVCRLDSRAALQIVDLLTAAIAFEFRQQLGLAGAHSPKADLARYVRDAFSVSSFLKRVDRSGVNDEPALTWKSTRRYALMGA